MAVEGTRLTKLDHSLPQVSALLGLCCGFISIFCFSLTHNQLDESAMSHLAEMFLELEAKIIRIE